MNQSTSENFWFNLSKNSTRDVELTLSTTTVEYDPDGFLYFYLVLKVILSSMGTIGNPLVIGAVLLQTRSDRLLYSGNLYIINLAIADFLVTSLVDLFTIVAICKSHKFFEENSLLCEIIAIVCIMACVSSLWTMTAIAANRYFYICKRGEVYSKLYKKNTILVSVVLIWFGSFLVDLPNLIGWGGHGFDFKSMVCTYDRTASYSYTLFFFIVAILIPIFAVVFCYASIYLYVLNHKRKIEAVARQTSPKLDTNELPLRKHDFQLLKTFIAIFLLFVVCWGSYGITVVADVKDTFPRFWHALAVALAHTNSSFNCILYGIYNKRFRLSYQKILGRLLFFDSFFSTKKTQNGKVNAPTLSFSEIVPKVTRNTKTHPLVPREANTN